MQIQPVTADIADSLGLKKAQGALVAEPQAGSPAAKAGIKAGDVIVSVNGEAVPDARTLARRISGMPPGTAVKIGVVRNGQRGDPDDDARRAAEGAPGEPRHRTRAQTGRRTDLPRLGLSLAPAADVGGAGDQGVVVTQVDPDGAAAAHGFKTGDVILDVGGKSVTSPADVRKALADAQAGGSRTVLMRVKSEQGTRFVALPLGDA